MISIRQQDYGLNVALFNEFTVQDFRQFEEAVLQCAAEVHRPDILLDLTLLRDFTVDMAIEQLKFARKHENDFGRIAIVVDDIWIALGTHLSSLLTNQHTHHFKKVEDAEAWLTQEVEA